MLPQLSHSPTREEFMGARSKISLVVVHTCGIVPFASAPSGLLVPAETTIPNWQGEDSLAHKAFQQNHHTAHKGHREASCQPLLTEISHCPAERQKVAPPRANQQQLHSTSKIEADTGEQRASGHHRMPSS